MNFLAHCLLGHPDEGLIAGGFIGDFIKGTVPGDIPIELQLGIRLHRRIDAVSNRLPDITSSVARLDPKLRRVAPVLLDIVGDHCLALKWNQHGYQELETFADIAYTSIDRYQCHLPSSGARFFKQMTHSNLFCRYRHPDTVIRAMSYVLKRLHHEHLDKHLEHIVNQDLPALMNDFDNYFPALKKAVAAWKVEIEFPEPLNDECQLDLKTKGQLSI